ncbi:MAG: hypothetical protein V4813_13090 [Gemmatimonadota bacterium]
MITVFLSDSAEGSGAAAAALKCASNLMIYVVSTNGIQSYADGPDRVQITPGFQWHGD